MVTYPVILFINIFCLFFNTYALIDSISQFKFTLSDKQSRTLIVLDDLTENHHQIDQEHKEFFVGTEDCPGYLSHLAAQDISISVILGYSDYSYRTSEKVYTKLTNVYRWCMHAIAHYAKQHNFKDKTVCYTLADLRPAGIHNLIDVYNVFDNIKQFAPILKIPSEYCHTIDLFEQYLQQNSSAKNDFFSTTGPFQVLKKSILNNLGDQSADNCLKEIQKILELIADSKKAHQLKKSYCIVMDELYHTIKVGYKQLASLFKDNLVDLSQPAISALLAVITHEKSFVSVLNMRTVWFYYFYQTIVTASILINLFEQISTYKNILIIINKGAAPLVNKYLCTILKMRPTVYKASTEPEQITLHPKFFKANDLLKLLTTLLS